MPELTEREQDKLYEANAALAEYYCRACDQMKVDGKCPCCEWEDDDGTTGK